MFKCDLCSKNGKPQNGTIKQGLDTLVEHHSSELELSAEFKAVWELSKKPDDEPLQWLAQLLLWFQMATPAWRERVVDFHMHVTKFNEPNKEPKLEDAVVRSLSGSLPQPEDYGMGPDETSKFLVNIECWAERMSTGLLPAETIEIQKQSHKAVMAALQKHWLATVPKETMEKFQREAPGAYKAFIEDIEDAAAAGSA